MESDKYLKAITILWLLLLSEQMKGFRNLVVTKTVKH